jgi:hypothetical protein
MEEYNCHSKRPGAGYQYQTPGGLPLEMVKNKIPKDILIFNWFFNDQENPVSFFAFKWVNKRFGKKIREINLKGTSNFINSQNKIIENNAIMLAAISIVKKREVPVIDPLK